MDKGSGCLPWIYQILLWNIMCIITPIIAGNTTVCEWTLPKGTGNLCYWMTPQLNTYTEARAECKNSGGDLVVISDGLEAAFVLDMIRQKDVTQTWIGLEEKIDSWKWITDNKEVRLQGCYRDNLDSRDLPSRTIQPQATHESCVEYCKGQGYKYAALQGTSCFCGNSFGKYGSLPFGPPDGCNDLCPGDVSRKQTCGANMASTVLATAYGYDNWFYGQPNNHQGYQTCAAIELDDDYRFNDIKCMERLGLICHLPDTSNKDCMGNGYTFLNETWCLHITNDSISWFDARYKCNQLGGNLLEIRDDMFNYALVNYLQSKEWNNIGFWLGLVKGKWIWSNGEDLMYSSWDPDRPNGAEQNCVIADNLGKWNDVACSAQFYAICYIDNSTLPTTTTVTATTAGDMNYTTAVTEDNTNTDMNFYFIIGGVSLFVLIAFITGLWQLKLCCSDKAEKNKNDFFFEFDTKGSARSDDNSRENGHVNKAFSEDIPIANEYTQLDKDDMTSSEDNNNQVYCDIHREDRPKSTEDLQKTVETFDLIADLENKS